MGSMRRVQEPAVGGAHGRVVMRVMNRMAGWQAMAAAGNELGRRGGKAERR
jgi:hypothetical protein